eukprot:4926170-Prymnesium_polylepis.1
MEAEHLAARPLRRRRPRRVGHAHAQRQGQAQPLRGRRAERTRARAARRRRRGGGGGERGGGECCRGWAWVRGAALADGGGRAARECRHREDAMRREHQH